MTGASNSLFVDANGNVGIGTTIPKAKLELFGLYGIKNSSNPTYTFLPNGFIIQGGYVGFTNDNVSITFPIAFPNACLGVYMTQISSGATSGLTAHLAGLSNTSFTPRFYQVGNGFIGTWLYYFAFGF
jgi:hypothetical protein